MSVKLFCYPSNILQSECILGTVICTWLCMLFMIQKNSNSQSLVIKPLQIRMKNYCKIYTWNTDILTSSLGSASIYCWDNYKQGGVALMLPGPSCTNSTSLKPTLHCHNFITKMLQLVIAVTSDCIYVDFLVLTNSKYPFFKDNELFNEGMTTMCTMCTVAGIGSTHTLIHSFFQD